MQNTSQITIFGAILTKGNGDMTYRDLYLVIGIAIFSFAFDELQYGTLKSKPKRINAHDLESALFASEHPRVDELHDSTCLVKQHSKPKRLPGRGSIAAQHGNTVR